MEWVPGQPPRSEDDWAAVSFEAAQLFSPSAPINERDLFAGRAAQIRKLLETITERGKHAILYGERGVGKTSLAKVFAGLFPETLRHIQLVREQGDPSDDFSSLWRKVFKDIQIVLVRDGHQQPPSLASLYEGQIAPDDVRRGLDVSFGANDLPIIVIDEFDKLSKPDINELMANTIKSLSDYSVNATVVLVGVADSVNELIGEHPSLARCLEQIPMPRMSDSELKEILDRRVPRLGMKMEGDALWKIVRLSRGLPSYAHSLGLYAVQNAADHRRELISEADVDAAIDRVLEKSQESLQEDYNRAVHSNKSDNLYRQVLLACALAESDERGTFAPLAVVRPLAGILKQEVKIAKFQQHLEKFITAERGEVLLRRGRERAFRFRFRDPMMQPFVLLKGIEQGFVDRSALEVLTFPAQPRLPMGRD